MKLSAKQHSLISRQSLVWVLVAQAASILPLLFRLPVWVWALWATALVWRVWIFRGRLAFPSTWTKLLLGIVCIAGIVFSYAGVVGVEPMVGFLVCAFVLKLVEMRTHKDALMVLFIAFIAVAAQFLFAQDILAALMAVGSLVVLLSAWQSVFSCRPRSVSSQFGRGSLLLLKSLPLMLILFVVMPRLGPLWSMPLPQGQGQTGFSDSLTLGDISELVRSPDTAFRVTFTGETPSSGELYWRGLLLDEFDGRTWRAAEGRFRSRVSPEPPGASSVRYDIILEPHYQRWLFALGSPTGVRSSGLNIQMHPEGLLYSRLPVTQKAAYSVESSLHFGQQREILSASERRGLTQLPSGVNPQARALAEAWLERGLDSRAMVDELLARFRASFVYTLQPAPSGTHAIDDFLFQSQRGFCEHFASSLVFVMRAAQVPARIVVGYQGGTAHPRENYLTIKQSDAHAWAEVWFEDVGWLPVDPTAAVAPSRIEMGVEQAVPEDERDLIGRSNWQSSWLQGLYQRYDAMGYSWHRWVLGYDQGIQDGLLNWLLGNSSPWRVAVAFVLLCALVVGALAVLPWLLRRRPHMAPERRAIERVLRRLARQGFERKSEESLSRFVHRVGQERPKERVILQKLVRDYEAVAYGGQATRLEELQRYARAYPNMPPRRGAS